MITLGEVSFVIIIQIIIFLIIISIFLTFLVLRKQKEINNLLETDNSNNISSTASTEHYLTTEIKLTGSRFDSLYKDEDRHTEYFTEPDWLILRKNFLEFEKQLLESTDRDNEHFWVNLGNKFKKLLDENNLVKRVKSLKENESDEDEVKELKMMIKSQNEEFENILSEFNDKEKLEIDSLKDKLIKLNRSHTELTHCIFVLEDENTFLREQIRGLLNLD